MKRQQIVLERPGDASFLLPLILFLKGNGLRNSISFGEPKLYVIQLRLGVCVLRTRVRMETKEYQKKKNIKREREKRREKTFIQTAAERKHNAVPFSRKSQGCPGSERLNYPFRKLKTKLKLQNFFYKSVSLSRPFGSSASISVTPLCCWLNTSERCGIDPVVHPFYYLFSHPKAALRFDSATVVEKHKFSSPFAVRGRINGCEIKP